MTLILRPSIPAQPLFPMWMPTVIKFEWLLFSSRPFTMGDVRIMVKSGLITSRICEVRSISLESPSSSYCFRAFKVCLESKMSDKVSVFSWLVYFLLVLLVSRLSLHHTRYESNLQMRKSIERKPGKFSWFWDGGKSPWWTKVLWSASPLQVLHFQPLYIAIYEK